MTSSTAENSCAELRAAAGAMQARAELSGTDAQLTAAAADRAPLQLLGIALRR
jgi:hypothetical protein